MGTQKNQNPRSGKVQEYQGQQPNVLFVSVSGPMNQAIQVISLLTRKRRSKKTQSIFRNVSGERARHLAF